MTHVTFVSYDDVPALGGQGRMLDELRSGLRRRGLTVTTVAGRGEHAVRFPLRIGRAPLDLSLHLGRHPELLTQYSPDLVHIFGGPGGVLFSKPLPVPVVYHAHHTYRQAHGALSLKRVLSIAEARAYRRASLVLAVSPSTAEAVAQLGVPRERIEVVPSGIAVPDEAGVERDANRILYVGRLEREKGVLDAISVITSLTRDHPGVTGCIVGSGRLAGEVRRMVAGFPNVAFRGGVDDRELHAEYARAAILVMPSRYEGLGRTAVEAQAAGTPVAGYDVTGLRDAVREGGVLVPVGNVEALRAACAALLGDPQRRARLGAAGREHVRRHHAPGAILTRLEQIYAGLLGAGSG